MIKKFVFNDLKVKFEGIVKKKYGLISFLYLKFFVICICIFVIFWM